jgi:hypothetical protein
MWVYTQRAPGSDEVPFYCLLEDDSLITKIAVETDQLLEDVGPQPDQNHVRLIITVRLRPYELHFGSLSWDEVSVLCSIYGSVLTWEELSQGRDSSAHE